MELCTRQAVRAQALPSTVPRAERAEEGHDIEFGPMIWPGNVGAGMQQSSLPKRFVKRPGHRQPTCRCKVAAQGPCFPTFALTAARALSSSWKVPTWALIVFDR